MPSTVWAVKVASTQALMSDDALEPPFWPPNPLPPMNQWMSPAATSALNWASVGDGSRAVEPADRHHGLLRGQLVARRVLRAERGRDPRVLVRVLQQERRDLAADGRAVQQPAGPAPPNPPVGAACAGRCRGPVVPCAAGPPVPVPARAAWSAPPKVRRAATVAARASAAADAAGHRRPGGDDGPGLADGHGVEGVRGRPGQPGDQCEGRAPAEHGRDPTSAPPTRSAAAVKPATRTTSRSHGSQSGDRPSSTYGPHGGDQRDAGEACTRPQRGPPRPQRPARRCRPAPPIAGASATV